MSIYDLEKKPWSGSSVCLQVIINISSVGFVPLYGSSDKKILALFSPTDWTTPVALYLLDKWWAVEDILRTADPARDGAVEVGGKVSFFKSFILIEGDQLQAINDH